MTLSTIDRTIDSKQRDILRQHLDRGDRVGFYVQLHLMTGSQAALDMAEISSSSDIRGGTAWAVNNAYEAIWDEYPDIGVKGFSIEIAQGDFDLIELIDGTDRYKVPSDLKIYLGALNTWNKVGSREQPPHQSSAHEYRGGIQREMRSVRQAHSHAAA